MKRFHLIDLVLLLSTALFLTFCSSSGGGTGGTGIISRGTITEFGSVVVNGTEFDTSDAAVIVRGLEVGRGDAAVLENLDIGRVVTVVGSGSEDMEDAIADRVVYRSDIKGPVAGILPDSETLKLQIAGRTVVLNQITRMKGTSFGTIAVNDMVEISGYDDDTGTTWATFVEKTGVFHPSLIVEVVGFVANLNEDLQQFEIAGLRVDYSNADLQQLPGEVPQNGLLVEVEGMLEAVDGEMQATKIVPADPLDAEDADQIEVMGFVTKFTSIYDFVVGSQKVQVEPDAEIVDGTLAHIGLGVKLEAEGILAGGVLYADEIEFWLPDQSEVEGLITGLTASGFTIGSLEVVTTPWTQYEDGAAGDIQPGVHIEVKGRLTGGVMQADKVSFEQE